MKTPYYVIYIIADDYWRANEIFKEETGYDFDSSTCDCCGSDFWVTEINSIKDDEVPEKRFGEDVKTLTLIG
tara:strand:- start:210 stop:425 length:216 start_codon:yes stop_codon:yes gene_type:complete